MTILTRIIGGTNLSGGISYTSVAGLRAATHSVTDGDFVQLESWHVGLRLGGGFFQYVASDTTSADDGGLIIVDVLGRRWKRSLNDGVISPTMWGAYGDGASHDAAAVNSAFSALRNSLDSELSIKKLDGGSLVYFCEDFIDATYIRLRHGKIRLSLIVADTLNRGSMIGLDFSASQFLHIESLIVQGSVTNPPDVGVWFGRGGGTAALPHSTSGLHSCDFIDVWNVFKLAALVNHASEDNSWGKLATNNRYYASNACSRMWSGSTSAMRAHWGRMPFSYALALHGDSIGEGDQSHSGNGIQFALDQRSPAYVYTIASISKSVTPLVTMQTPGDLVTAAASYGLANGSKVHFLLTGTGGSFPGTFFDMTGHVATVQNLNTGAGTFELSDFNTSAFSDTFNAGTLRNDTGPGVVKAQLASDFEHDGYGTAYSLSKVKYFLNTGSVLFDVNWHVKIYGRFELTTAHTIEFVVGVNNVFFRGFNFSQDNEGSRVSPFLMTSAGGICYFSSWEAELGHNAGQPVEMFTNPQYVALWADKCVPVRNSNQAMKELDEDDYAEIVADTWRLTALPRRRHLGNRLCTSLWTWTRKISGAGVARFECTEDSAALGPLVDIARERPGAGVANDFMGALRFLGQDSASNETSYAYIRSQIITATDGSEDGAIGINTLIAGVDTQIIRLSKYGLQGGVRSQTLATDAGFTLAVTSSPVQTFHTGVLTIDRTVVLSTVAAFGGARFRITRTGAGAFNLIVTDSGTLKTLATNTWGEFVYDATAAAWKLAAYGTL